MLDTKNREDKTVKTHPYAHYWLILVGLLLFMLPTSAQGTFAEYGWQAGDLALRYPSAWDAPATTQRNGNEALLLAQAFASAADVRPPAIPFITLVVAPAVSDGPDVYTRLEQELASVNIRASGPRPSTLLGGTAIATQGSSADGAFFGVGRAGRIPGERVLLVYGRAPAERQDAFMATFNAIVGSIASGSSTVTDAPEYGVLWHTESLPSDGPDAFINLRALALAADGLYAADLVAGVLRFDTLTGARIETIPFADFNVMPQDIALGEGTLYVADSACGCVRVWRDGSWHEPLADFGFDAPQSVAFVAGTLYATDFTENGPTIRAFTGADMATIDLAQVTGIQPQLVADAANKRLLVVTSEGGVLTPNAENTLTPIYELALSQMQVNDMVLAADGHLLVATQTQALLIFDEAGQLSRRVGRIANGLPLPGEILTPMGVAVDEAGTIFWADSSGGYGNVTAMSLAVEPGRVGATMLRPDLPVQGTLSNAVSQQAWRFEASAGDTITLTAVADVMRSPMLNLAVRVLGPNGDEIAFNDDHGTTMLFNPQDALLSLRVDVSGQYVVAVNSVSGEGRYTLGTNVATLLMPDTTAATGRLRDAIPLQNWQFNGQAGQQVTVTMLATSGNLDPRLRLLGPDGSILMENDDARDPALGRNAQLDAVTLPADGLYIIEAARFGGEGRYTLQIRRN
jgi:hypothetical protein